MAAVCLLTAAAAACSEGPSAPVTVPEHALLALGNGHFFFNAPLGTGGSNGVFNPRLRPVVEICRLATSSQPTMDTPCAALIARFETEPGDRYHTVQIDVRREAYFVNWDLSRFELATGYYRITVRSAASTGANTLLGLADVAVAPAKAETRAMAGPGVLPATTTQTVPIKFRIEEGALCEQEIDCFEGSVDDEGGVFVTGQLQAGAEFPAGAVDGTHTIIIERVDADDVAFCLPTHQPQYEGCYRYRLEPALAPGETFDEEVVVGVCLDPAAYAFEDELELQKWDEVDPASLQSLPRREIDFLECEGFESSARGDGFWSRLAHGGRRLLAPVAAFLGPRPLYAGKSPFGGGLNDFSRIGWVRPLALEVAAGDGQEACVDASLAQDPAVRVTSLLSGLPLAGVPISFDVAPGSGSVAAASDASDGDGLASTHWTLGQEGENTLLAHGHNPLSGWPQWTETPPVWATVELHATGAAGISATFLSPLGSAHTGTPGYASGLAPVLRIELCALDDAGECVGEVTTYGGFVEHADIMAYRLFWTPPALANGTVYRLAALVDGHEAGTMRITGDETLRDAETRHVRPGITFSVKLDLVAGGGC